MTPQDVSIAYEERVLEILSYLDFLNAIEIELQRGAPKIGNTTVTTLQQRILYSSAFLQFYNLVEATVTWCIKAVSTAASNNGNQLPHTLSEHLRREWVRSIARTHTEMSAPSRLDAALILCQHLVDKLPIVDFEIAKGGGGNWDDNEIEVITSRIGVDLTISRTVYSEIKRKIKDDKSPLVLIRELRNSLAHGETSFAECGSGVTVSELRQLNDRITNYLREVIQRFAEYINSQLYLDPISRALTSSNP